MDKLTLFDMLEFKPHHVLINGDEKHAIIFFDNGYGASVITGRIFYTDEEHPYELAVLKKNEDGYDICYDTPITNDILGHLTAEDVDRILCDIKNLKEEKNND